MNLLLKNGYVINVFTGEIERKDVLINTDTGLIQGTGNYSESDADEVTDVTGKYICPAFIDGHIHIESTMLLPSEFAKAVISHGTAAIAADPHEIANVCGADGVNFMIEASRNLPLDVYICLPSCVPATSFDEAGAVMDAESLKPFYDEESVIALGEMMNYPAVIAGEPDVMRKIEDAHNAGRIVNGHAPSLTGTDLDKYIAAGINDDHESGSFWGAAERIRKGQWVMIREGTAARNLESLLPLFEPPFSHRCLLVTDDKHPADILSDGHIDSIIRKAVRLGKSAVTGIQMATIQAAQCFGLKNTGAVAPSYKADILVLSNLSEVTVESVYHNGRKVCENGVVLPFDEPVVSDKLKESVLGSFKMKTLDESDFTLTPESDKCRVIGIVAGELVTDELICDMDFSQNNGIDTERDLLKIAVVERHHNTGHIGLGFISGTGMKHGAIASSVSHDSHNLIIIGTNEADMAAAGNRVREMGGGNVVVKNGDVIAEMALPVAGLMSMHSAEEAAAENKNITEAVHKLGVAEGISPFMNMAFVSLPVIPSLKMTTHGLIDVNKQELVPLFIR